MTRKIEAIFEHGVFRPLQRVDLPEHQRVTLQLPEAIEGADNNAQLDENEELDEEITYKPMPPDNVRTIPVKFRFVGEIDPLPYPIDEDELDALNELE